MMIKVRDLFDLSYGVNLEYNKMEPAANGIPFIGRCSTNNGVVGYVKKVQGLKENPANTISVAASGSVLESFLQEQPYYSGRDLFYLKPKQALTKKQMLFYCMILRSNKYRYSYGRQANRTLGKVLIPRLEEIPKWVDEVDIPEQPSSKPCYSKKLSLQDRAWQYFNIGSLFDVRGTKTTLLAELKKMVGEKYPYITTQSSNNGVAGDYGHCTEKGNVITIESAVTGYATYQGKPFSASDHIEQLKIIGSQRLNRCIALFLVTLLNKNQYRYSYGRKRSQQRIKEEKIKLPITDQGQPDWHFMESYIKSLPYSSNLTKL